MANLHLGGGVPSAKSRDSRYSLKWNHYQTVMTTGLAELLEDEECSMADVTLACEGEFIQAHKVVLALSSPFFRKFFKINRVDKAGTTLVALANLKFKDLKNIIQFIYHGEVHLSNSDLSSFMTAANLLQIQGLVDTTNFRTVGSKESPLFEPSMITSFGSTRARSTKNRSPPASSDSESSLIPAKRICVSSESEPIRVISEQFETLQSECNQPPSLLEDNTSMSSTHDQSNEKYCEEVEEEAMINLDCVKPEPISVYSVDESGGEGDYMGEETGDSTDVGADGSVPEHDQLEIVDQDPNVLGSLYNPTSSESTHFSVSEPVRLRSNDGATATTTLSPGYSATESRLSAKGRCKFCPTQPRTVSRTRCNKCRNFLCAKRTCRVNLKIIDYNSVVHLCRNCADHFDDDKT